MFGFGSDKDDIDGIMHRFGSSMTGLITHNILDELEQKQKQHYNKSKKKYPNNHVDEFHGHDFDEFEDDYSSDDSSYKQALKKSQKENKKYKKLVDIKSNKISQLQKQINEIQKTNAEQNSSYSTVNTSLKNKLHFAQSKIASLQLELEAVKMVKAQLEQQSNKNNEHKFQKLIQQNEDYKTESVRQRKAFISLQKEYQTLRNERDSTQNRLKELKIELNQVTMEKNKLKGTVVDQKELQMEIQDLKEQIRKLKLTSIDTRKYSEWDNEQILEWIMNLEDGRYKIYEDTLRVSLSEEGIQGCDLDEVNEGDVKGWGVKKFRDKKDLTKNIKQLVRVNVSQNMVNTSKKKAPITFIENSNEGDTEPTYYK